MRVLDKLTQVRRKPTRVSTSVTRVGISWRKLKSDKVTQHMCDMNEQETN